MEVVVVIFQIQGMELRSPFEQVGAMYNEGGPPEFVVDQGLLYPAATSYGYYCTGQPTVSPCFYCLCCWFLISDSVC